MADFNGTAGNDTFLGTLVADNILGEGGDDLLRGDAGADIIFGGLGNDTLTGGAGSDTISGGNGYDIVEFAENGGSGAVVDLSANGGMGSWQDAFGDFDAVALATVEAYRGTGGSDTFTGDMAGGTNPLFAADFFGEGGNDVLTGSGLDDLLDGGADDDVLNGLGGDDSLLGGAGIDFLFGGADDDQLDGGDGADVIDGGTGFDTLTYANAGGAILLNLGENGFAGLAAAGDVVSNIEQVIGTEFGDTITGDGEVIFGEIGNDQIVSLDGASDLFGGQGDDLLIVAGTDVASGRVFDGGIGSNELRAEGAQVFDLTGATVVNISTLSIVLDGGTTVRLLASQSRQLSRYSEAGFGAGLIEVLMSTETSLDLSFVDIEGFDQDEAGFVIKGDGDGETIAGTSVVDTISGGGGDDLIKGGSGADSLDGGTGFDTISYADAAGAVTVNFAIGLGTGGQAAGDRLSGFEEVIGSEFGDVIISGAGIEIVHGGGGTDLIVGSNGADVLYGGAEDDRIAVSAANLADNLAYYGGDGTDALDITPGTASVLDLTGLILDGLEELLIETGTGNLEVRLTAGQAEQFEMVSNGSHPGFSRIFAVEMGEETTLDLSGTVFDGFDQPGDGIVVTGDDDGDTITGGGVIDTLLGGEGDDVLGGSPGADSLNGGAGFDTIDYSGSTVGVTVNLLTQAVSGAGSDAEGDQVSGFERVVGSAFNDTFFSADGHIVEGGGGADLLRVEPGTSIAFGQAGDDLLALRASSVQTGSEFNGGGGLDRLVVFDVFDATQDLRDDIVVDFETLAFQSDLAGLTVRLLASQVAQFSTIEASGSNDRLVDVDMGTSDLLDLSGVALAGFASDETVFRVTGDGDAETITGSAIGDTIEAGGGDDTVDANLGDDTVAGGEGIDTLSFASLAAPNIASGIEVGAFVDLGLQGTAQDTQNGLKTATQFENLLGSNFADILSGDGAANTVDGGAGRDLLEGSGGDDLLLGGDGFDVLIGGAGVDTLFGGAGENELDLDIAAYFESSGPIVFDFGASLNEFDAGSSAEILEDVIGGDIEGFAGSDGFSNTFDASEVSELTFFMGGSVGDMFYGGTNTDQLVGLAGDDVLYGNDGQDALIGDAGNDMLFGGAGPDTFFFDGVRDGDDVIGDFDLGLDELFFSGGVVLGLQDVEVTEALVDANTALDTVLTYGATGDRSTITILDIDSATFIAGADFTFLA